VDPLIFQWPQVCSMRRVLRSLKKSSAAMGHGLSLACSPQKAQVLGPNLWYYWEVWWDP
jgi:hypothetical protein